MKRLRYTLTTPLFTICLSIVGLAQKPFPVELSHRDGKFFLQAQPGINELRVAVYDGKGARLADSGVLTTAPLQWQVRASSNAELPSGHFLGVVWLKEATQSYVQLLHIEVTGGSVFLETASNYPPEPKPLPDEYSRKYSQEFAQEYLAAKQQNHATGEAAANLFRVAIKVVPEESAAYVAVVLGAYEVVRGREADCLDFHGHVGDARR